MNCGAHIDWIQQEQQQQQGNAQSFGKLHRRRHEGDDNRAEEAAGNEKIVVRENHSFQVDLKIQGVSQEAMCQVQERMTKI